MALNILLHFSIYVIVHLIGITLDFINIIHDAKDYFITSFSISSAIDLVASQANTNDILSFEHNIPIVIEIDLSVNYINIIMTLDFGLSLSSQA